MANLNDESYIDPGLPGITALPNLQGVSKIEQQKISASLKAANAVRSLKMEANRMYPELEKIKHDFEFEIEQEHHFSDEVKI